MLECLQSRTSIFSPTFGFELKHWLFLDLKPAGLWTITILSALLISQSFGLGLVLHHWFSWVSSLPTSDLGICQLSSLYEPIPYNKFIHICVVYTHTLFILFPWSPLTNSVSFTNSRKVTKTRKHLKISTVDLK